MMPIKSSKEVFAQISQFIMTQTSWTPAIRRIKIGEPITIAISVPIKFWKDSLNLYGEKRHHKTYFIDNREYVPLVKNNNFALYERKFEVSGADEIRFRSEKFFDLLYNHPEIISIAYKALYLGDIGELGVKISEQGKPENILIRGADND